MSLARLRAGTGAILITDQVGPKRRAMVRVGIYLLRTWYNKNCNMHAFCGSVVRLFVFSRVIECAETLKHELCMVCPTCTGMLLLIGTRTLTRS